MLRSRPSPSVCISIARKAVASTSISSFSTGVTSTWLPSGSRRRTVENSRTIAGRLIGEPWWYQVPSRAMRISLCPQCSGFHLSTGGSRRSSISFCRSARLTPCNSIGGRLSGMARHCFARAGDDNRAAMQRSREQQSSPAPASASARSSPRAARGRLDGRRACPSRRGRRAAGRGQGRRRSCATSIAPSGSSPRPTGSRRCACWSTMPPASLATSFGAFDAESSMRIWR